MPEKPFLQNSCERKCYNSTRKFVKSKKRVFLVEKSIVRKLEWNRFFFIFLPLKTVVESLQKDNGKRDNSKLKGGGVKELFCLLLS